MSECRCNSAFDNRNGHAHYCPVWKDERITELEAENQKWRKVVKAVLDAENQSIEGINVDVFNKSLNALAMTLTEMEKADE